MALASIDLQAIRTAVKTRLDSTLTGVVNVYANNVDEPRPPSVTIVPSADGYATYFDTFGDRGLVDVNLTLLIETGARTIDAQIKLDGFLSIGTPTSVIDPIFADRTLGNVVQDCVALSATVSALDSGYVASVPLQIIVKKGGN